MVIYVTDLVDPMRAEEPHDGIEMDDGSLPGQGNARAAATGPSTVGANASLIDPSCLGSLRGGSSATLGATAIEILSHRGFSENHATSDPTTGYQIVETSSGVEVCILIDSCLTYVC